MRILGLTGWSGSGKTTLLTALLPLFIARGFSVSTVKHAHHGFDLDQPGKDSWRHRQAGAREVMIASGVRWALMHELDGPEPALPELVRRLSPVDLVLVEGFKANPHPKIEVHRPALGQPPMWPGRSDIVAVACDAVPADCDRPILPLNDPAAIVDWVHHFVQTNDAVHTTP
ncbi:molybdopterin-guanine dinucleotide biosynthesis protein B [Limobrevibacterium gyesilva]|uniref:Molybdopterin-guanine dinucleotide biosynthesis protein B n=1 Tax=Limobrevibacterium gyesilva TaxID=2991712 RepID=A0AA41YNL8_9PROT|nr:molybdopterin-guanine dinucleotide biosynthesis protein B [Limobrevibacterium gyesilva]MCW3476010.1 molybdopterin-guanine dinucleotide biosynthesis protein B [Limobrevibacterium gyesilva]